MGGPAVPATVIEKRSIIIEMPPSPPSPEFVYILTAANPTQEELKRRKILDEMVSRGISNNLL